MTKSRKSCCTTPGIGVVGIGFSKKFNVKVFYVMGKALSGELSCPCDRSCFLGGFFSFFFLTNFNHLQNSNVLSIVLPKTITFPFCITLPFVPNGKLMDFRCPNI